MRPGALLAVFLVCLLAVCLIFAPQLSQEARFGAAIVSFVCVAIVAVLER